MKFFILSFIAFSGVLTLYKRAFETLVLHTGAKQEKYQLAKQVMVDLESNAHPVIIEKGFQALTGKIYSVEEIHTLLACNEPSSAIRDRAGAAGFIEFDRERCTYDWRGKYKKAFVRKYLKLWYYVWYLIFGFASFAPFYLSDITALGKLPVLTLFALLIGLAIMCLLVAGNYLSAQKFMANFTNQ